jgi:dTMP kinase
MCIVVVEGLDGVGKSTVVRALAAALGAGTDGTPGAAVGSLRAIVDEMWSPAARQLFYAGSVLDASDRMAAARAAERSYVFDRYWASTVAYDVAIRRTGLDLSALEARLSVPDLTVFLDAPRAVRAGRMHGRARLTGEDHQTLDPATDAALSAAYRDALARPFAGRLCVVDARAPVDAVVAGALAALDRGVGRVA